ncbi:protein toll-like [Vanessa tameamea]|uniref:Protein toll-like n=1 Tax=Vanessa tameamea TaxID=334116 RepID=A0A8B8IWE5_VANTA
MTAWLFLFIAAAAAAAAAAADHQMSLFDLASNYWGGPERGCVAEEGAGQLILSCTLPSGNLTLYVDRAATILKIVCEKNSTLVCDEIQEAKQYVDKYIVRDASRQLSFMSIETCGLSSESLACPLSVVGAAGTSLMKLQEVGAELEPLHVQGLNTTKFRMYDVDENITEVPYKALSLLPALKSFSMKGGSLVLKPEQEEYVLPELVTLELADGNLKSLPKGAFKNTPRVQSLLLWGNRIASVDVDAFEGLAHLVNLSLNVNLISHLPGGLFRYSPHVGRVDLYVNRLLRLSEDVFSGLKELKEILIFDNKETLELDDRSLSNLPSLYNLKLEKSSIAALPADLFANTTNLKTLSLKGNKIKALPSGIFSEQKLRVLNLSNNSISELPADVFVEQDSLVKLELQRNGLESLPDGLFADLKSLKELDLSDNSVKKLSNFVFNGLSSLTELSLAGNRIEYLSQAVFEFTPNLESLSFARNNMTISKQVNSIAYYSQPSYALDDLEPSPHIAVHSSPFHRLTQLRRLDLSRNRVSLVCEDWTRMFHLTDLDLSYNNFTTLTDVDMDFPTNVTVDFRHNNIEQFRPNVNTPNSDVPTFMMDYNPYRCDCELYHFISNYKSGRRMATIKISKSQCSRPTALRGVRLMDLKAEDLTCEVNCSTGDLITGANRPANSSDCDSCTIRPDKSRIEMSCSSIPEDYPPLPHGVHSTYIKLKRAVDISDLPQRVTLVDLSSLNLTRPPTATSVALNLTDNALTAAPIDLFERNCTLYLRSNPFDCSCEARSDVVALNAYRTRIADYEDVTCSSGVLVANVAVGQLCAARDAAVLGAALAALGLVLAVCTAIAYRYSTEIRILLRKYGLYWARETDGEPYDAFVSFAHQDEEFVMKRLLPNLESGRAALRLCVHYRDWVVGDWIPAQIARSVEQSRYTIIVLSRHFAASPWARMEFRAAHGRQRVLVLLLADAEADAGADPAALADGLDPELRAYVAMNTYVRADDPLVWDRLKDAVCRSRRRVGDGAARCEPAEPAKPPGALHVQLENGKLVNRAPAV